MAQEAFNRALAIAKRHGDVALEMEVLANAANVHFFSARSEEAVRTCLRAVELSQEYNQPRTELTARYIATLSLKQVGNLKDASRHAEAMLPLAEMLHDDFWIALSCWMGEITRSAEGDWESARSFSDRAMAAGPGSPAIFTRTLLEFESGRFDDGNRFLEQLLKNASESPPWPLFTYASAAYCIAVTARITGVPDRFELAEESADRILSASNAIATYRLTAQMALAIIAVIKDDAPNCRKLYTELLVLQGSIQTAISVDRILGLMSQSMSNLDQAALHFEDALTFCRKGGYHPELAWSCCDYADMLVERQNDGDQAKAMTLLDESLSISTELGMKPLMERVQSRQQKLGAQAS